MVIGILDKDKAWQKKEAQTIQLYLQGQGKKAVIRCFDDGDALFTEKSFSPAVLFLGITTDEGSNWMITAEQVNQYWPECLIVYLADSMEYAIEVYETGHIYFLLKEDLEEKLESVFKRIFYICDKKKMLHFICRDKKMVCLFPKEIYYFERNQRITLIETDRGKYEIYDKIDDIVPLLPAGEFVRCHNSYIINLSNVMEAMKTRFLMKDGKSITISRSYAKETKEALVEWLRKLGGG